MRCSAGSGPNALEATDFASARKGSKHNRKNATLIAGFQLGGKVMANADFVTMCAEVLPLVEPGKIHSLVQSSHLLGVTIKHLRANPIGVEQ